MAIKKISLSVEGMTCAACSSRVEKGLAKTPGISIARVNLSTEKAMIQYDTAQTDLNSLAHKVEQLGYHLVLPQEQELSPEQKARHARRQLFWAWVFAGPGAILMILHMSGLLHLPYWHIIELALAFPVIFIVGWQVQRAAFLSFIQWSLGMDVLLVAARVRVWERAP